MIAYTGIHYIWWDAYFMIFIMVAPLKQETTSFDFFSAAFQRLELEKNFE